MHSTAHSRSRRIGLFFIGLFAALVMTVGVAAAQTDPYTSDPGSNQGPGASGATPLPRPSAAPGLASTGTETMVLVTVGIGLVAGGAAFVVVSRRRETAPV